MDSSHDKNNIAVLVGIVKNIKFNQVYDFLKINELFAIIFSESRKVRSKFINKSSRNKCDAYDFEAEQDIIISLIDILHDKFTDFIKSVDKKCLKNEIIN